TRNTATSSGTLIATLTTDGQRVSVTPPTRWARAVASGTGLDGSILHVECPALSASGGGNVFNAADYGAVGDGSDATVAINAAVQAACASTGP
ncbi:glycoside hydrolase family 55 protein, partial [Escherichia coli]|uniref:glycoside hydrolase family 55 protein n=1 Tax=Escherichia coli TaxID=562 RepID=UPI00200D562D